MDKTMKAAVVRKFGRPLTIEEVEVPRPGANEILVKIEACGVCHTDLHAAEGDWPVKPNPPFIPGHEAVGHVVAVGIGIAHVKEGNRIGILRALPWRLGDAVRAAEKHGLLGQWRFRRIRPGQCRLRRPPAE